ncbi:MAG: shikimate dehydrogenase [Lentisphaeria bacterium]|nr:shikimate dehydrogenase [Lentisphaeria bacterium]
MLDFTPLAQCRFAVIGDPIAHTRSPQLQNPAFEAIGRGSIYGMLHVRLEELGEFAAFAGEHLDGVNLTVPHKEKILPFLDTVSPEAALAHSVNTLVCREGKLHGFSTDGYGLTTAVQEAFGIVPQGLSALFLGCGGATHATAFYLALQGASELFLVNRTVAKAEALAESLRQAVPALHVECCSPADTEKITGMLERAQLLIQATSVGLHTGDPLPLAEELLAIHPEMAVFDTIYPATPFLRAAARQGHPVADGRGMLLHQGAKSFEIWTGEPAPVEVMRQALERSLQK